MKYIALLLGTALSFASLSFASLADDEDIIERFDTIIVAPDTLK